VAFEFRWVAKPHHRRWDLAFAAGSTVAAFSQGLILGAVLAGIPVSGGAFSGGAFSWLTPFSLMCGCALIVGYALIGACWIAMKTSAAAEARARRQARGLLGLLLFFIVLVSIWTPLEFARVAQRWFSWPNIAYLSPVPAVTAALAITCWRALPGRHPTLAFYSAVGLFVVAFIGLMISTLPYLVPPVITLWQAAAAPRSQAFMLSGMALMIPVILGYTVFVYRTFSGKVRPGEGYH
jgi:cytochrome d ubiquinol oxidase subunit II